MYIFSACFYTTVIKWIIIWPKIHLLQGTSCTAARALRPCALRPRVFQLVYCGSCIITYSLSCKTQAAMHNKECSLSHALRLPQCMICRCRSLPGWVEFSLPQRCSISPFIRSEKKILFVTITRNSVLCWPSTMWITNWIFQIRQLWMVVLSM